MIRLPEGMAGRFALAVLVGALGVLAFEPFGQCWLAPLVCLGFFLLLRVASSPRQGLMLGLGFGLGFFLAGTSWVYVSLSVFGGMPGWLAGLGTFLFCTLLAALPMAVGGIFKRWQPDGDLAQALWFAGLLALADWTRGWLFTGFPWLAWGYSQTPPSPLAGFAPVLGVYGLSLLVALVGALLLRWRVGVPVLFALVVAGWGLGQRAWTQPAGPAVSVALVQGNVPQEMKWEASHFFRTLRLYRDLVERYPARLTVLPETAIPAFVDEIPREFVADLRQLALRQEGDILFGAATGSGKRYWNSAVSLGASPGQVYSKSHLVPFGEFVPDGFAWFLAMARIPMSQFSRGPADQPVLNLVGAKVAANICYEDAFGEEVIRALPEAGILVNLSNTAWFGQSLAQAQHLQISRLRALESGRPMLRATNTGMTAAITPDGMVQGVLPPFVRGVLRVEVVPYGGLTPYARWGNGLAVALALLCLLLGQRAKLFSLSRRT